MAPKRPPDQFPAIGSFDRRFLKRGKHSTILCLPSAYHAPIGLVVAYWGTFENVFNCILRDIIEGEANDGGTRNTAGWFGSEFRRRRELFKAICREWLASWKPEEAKLLADLCDRAGDLRWKRDMIAHGVYGYTILPGSNIATDCHALNEKTGDKMPFDEYSLLKLYHDISHMTADLVLISVSCAETAKGQFLAVPDTEILRVFRETNRQNRATSDKPPPPPPPSP